MTDSQFSALITAIASIAGVLIGSGITFLSSLLHSGAEKKQRIFASKKTAYENLISAIEKWRGCRALHGALIPLKGKFEIDEGANYIREYTDCTQNVLVCILQAQLITTDLAKGTIDRFRDVFLAETYNSPLSNTYLEVEALLLNALYIDLHESKLPKPDKQKFSNVAKK